MANRFDKMQIQELALLSKQKQPSWISPMLATLTKQYFSSPDWIFERKLDGIRCLAFRRGQQLRLLSRNRKDLRRTYPEIVTALLREKCDDFVVDGEIVAFAGSQTSFSRLQTRMGLTKTEQVQRSKVKVYFYIFDILHLEGKNTRNLPLLSRKLLLRRAIKFQGLLRFTNHNRRDGEKLLVAACRRGWEGLIAKRASAPYVQRRSRDWLKFKCSNRQELVIAGYTQPHGSRTGFGALLVGYYERGKLRYAGKVGAGYDTATLKSLGARLRQLERASCPFAVPPKESAAHWVRPQLVGEFAFTEWTAAGKLRHPTFLGLRTDKSAKKVRRERASR